MENNTESIYTEQVYNFAKKATAKDLAKLMDDFVNFSSSDYTKGIATGEILRSSHRTLQGAVIRFCLGVIVGLSRQEYTDARNEVPVKTSQKIAQMLESGELEKGYLI